MTESNEAQAREREATENNPAGGGEIRFLKEKRRKGPKALILAVLLLVAGIAYALFARTALLPQTVPATTGEVQNANLLVDRLWVDKIPERDMDKFNFYIFSSEENLALNDQAQSSYRHLLEIFFYRATARDLQYQFPHDRRSGKTTYAIEKLGKPDKNQIDLKLTITADPQSKGEATVYYSSTKWSSLDKSTLPATLQHVPTRPHDVE